VVNRPALPRSGSDKRGLAARGGDIEHELDSEPADGVDDRVDLGVVLAGLKLDDTWLGHAELCRQSALAQLVFGAIPQKGRGELSRRSEPLPFGFEAGSSVRLFSAAYVTHGSVNTPSIGQGPCVGPDVSPIVIVPFWPTCAGAERHGTHRKRGEGQHAPRVFGLRSIP